MTERFHSASPYEPRYGFCRALRRGNHIHVAGTAPIGPDGQTVPGGAFEQTVRCFALAVQAIEELGGTRDDVVRTRMFITDASDADDIGRAHHAAFGGAPPVATMVVVAALLDPAWRVEIEVEAQLDRT
jgi:enamine deaminase RidA (YjgF/YER057c/UK114 family)